MARNLFPPDLLRLQTDWIRTYEALAQRAPTESTTALRRRLIELSCRLAGHDFWAGPGGTAERASLRRTARRRPADRCRVTGSGVLPDAVRDENP
ncbi:hypothetical protein [Streptomyces wuyuanensis]|uniref:Uncharacterized protein n=1 Tax=Streptomyces wuyuanensis TaxID=1196353 RepID=A0A1G9TSB5_9ACTN|nr:hypothetical protein [Streptomyces wuyuanensis]SDM50619.1 hypothetical protein SAMN05444921_10980 [Streptomyces wuyuanensis]